MEYILAFVLFNHSGIEIDIKPEYQFYSYEQCERFANNETHQIIIDKYSGQGYARVIPACKEITRNIAIRILNTKGI